MCSLLVLMIARPLLLMWGIDGSANFLLTLCIGDLAMVPLFTTRVCAAPANYTRAQVNVPLMVATTLTAPPVVGIVLVLRSQDGIPILAFAGVGACAVAVWAIAVRRARRHRREGLHQPVRLDDPRHADSMISVCRRELQDACAQR